MELAQVFTRHNSHTSPEKIDEFIDKLLASQKFDALVEKFAQKAIDRIIDTKRDFNLNKGLMDQINAPQPIELKNISYKTDIRLGEPSLLKNLSLKFKYFTKPAFNNMNSSKNKENMHIKELDLSDTKNSSDKKFENSNDESLNLSDLESSLRDKPEDPLGDLKHNDIQGDGDNTSDGNELVKHKGRDDSISIENKRNSEILSENELPEDHKNNEIHVNDASDDFNRHVKNDGGLFHDDNKDIKRREKRIHREGNRVYTFRSSSDYEEYHQELDRVEKERQVFV